MRRNALSHNFASKSKPIFILSLTKAFLDQGRNDNGIQKFLELLAKRRAFTSGSATDLERFLH
jgi:hypothetical protein